ncbi:MAG: holo-ACP synthase [Actinomycetota bacterium]
MIGVDVVDIARFRAALQRTPALERRLFTRAERDYCRAAPDPVLRLAGTLAAKEAVIKALRLGSLAAWGARIEIARRADGAPRARVGAREIAVSISHDGPVAVAVALDPTLGHGDGRGREVPRSADEGSV